MRLLLICAFLLLSSVCVASDDIPLTKGKVEFSQQEAEWLKSNPVVTVAIKHGWAPIEFLNESNQPRGISVSYLKRIEEVSGIKFHIVQAADDIEMEQAYIIASVSNKNILEDTGYIPLEKPYITMPYGIFTINSEADFDSLDDLNNKKVAVFKSKNLIDFLQSKYPKINLVKVDIATEALEALSTSKVDAYVGNTAVVSYNAKNEGFSNIKLVAQTTYMANVYMAIREDQPILNSIMNKSVKLIPERDKAEIIKNWSGVVEEREFSYNLLLRTSVALLIVSTFVAFWNWRLKKEVVQRKHVEERLSLLDMCIKHLNDIVIITDTEPNAQRIIFVNNAFETRTGYKREEVIGKTTKILQGPKTQREELDKIRNALSNWQPVRAELINYTKDGKEYWLDMDIVPVKDDKGWVTHWIAVERDISERKKSEAELIASKMQAESANVAKSNFLANMSHEIRTPMNGVIGMTSLLSDTKLDKVQSEYVKTIKESSNALLKIINDILDFSKIDANMLAIESVEFSLAAVVESCIDLVSPSAKNKSLNLLYYVDSNIPKSLVGDPNRVRQILINLLNNAIKFTRVGNIDLEVTLTELAGDCKIRFVVKDTGIGMSGETLNKLFQPFTQADESISRQYGGTGLGLSITKRLVELMHGDIHAESIETAGSTFTVNIPFQLSEKIESEISISNIAGIKVVVWDKNELHGDNICKYLKSWRMTATYSDMPDKKTVMMLSNRKVDLLIVNQTMVEAHADEVATALRDCGAFVKVIFISDVKSVERYFPKIDSYTVLREPVKQSNLYNALVEVFDKTSTTEPIESEATESQDGDEALLGYKVLVVDDNQLNLQVAAALMRKIGLNVDTASSGREALRAIGKQRYSIIFMDCQMPDMDGFEATKRIREAEGQLGIKTPIIAMTANAMAGDREICLASGMDDYLTKPIDAAALKEVIYYWLFSNTQQVTAAPEVVTTQDKILDIKQLESMFGDDKATISEMLNAFISHVPELLVILKTAVDSGDAEQIKAISHQLAGASSSYGFNSFSQITRKIENLAKQNELDGIQQVYQELVSEFARAKDYVLGQYLTT